VRLPYPQRSRAVLIGVSVYDSVDLAGLPGVRNNLQALHAVLSDPRLGGLAPECCTVLAEPKTEREVYRTLRKHAEEAEDTLIVYFAGHGMVGPLRNELYLCLTDTDPNELLLPATLDEHVAPFLMNTFRAANMHTTLSAWSCDSVVHR
jgi:hypothetical protein